MLGSWYFKDTECMEKKLEKEPESVECEHKGKCPRKSEGKCFLEGMQERSPAKNLHGSQAEGEEQED